MWRNHALQERVATVTNTCARARRTYSTTVNWLGVQPVVGENDVESVTVSSYAADHTMQRDFRRSNLLTTAVRFDIGTRVTTLIVISTQYCIQRVPPVGKFEGAARRAMAVARVSSD